jgi:hypothetical protein
MMEKKTVQMAMTTGMTDSKRGRWPARRGKIRTDTAKGIIQSKKPKMPIFRYLFMDPPDSPHPLFATVYLPSLAYSHRHLINFSGKPTYAMQSI